MFTLMAEHFHGHHDHGNRHGDSYGHIRGTIDPSITTSERGIWAIKWSFIGLAVTALLQLVVVLLSHSVGLLADAIHNFGDAATAIPLWIAFMLSRWKPNAKFTYGYGRVEDLAGMAIVLTIFVSAVVAGYETVQRFSHPQAVDYLWAVIAASIGRGTLLPKKCATKRCITSNISRMSLSTSIRCRRPVKNFIAFTRTTMTVFRYIRTSHVDNS